VASYHDLLDAIARVRSVTGDPDAWKKGLTGNDVTTACNPASQPAALGAVLAKLTAAHPDVFLAPSPAALPPRIGEGAAAEAIRDAEAALAHQNTDAAHVDLQVVTAVLNAHTAHDEGLAELTALQRDIENAVTTRPDLDTPAGSREFQRFLIGKLRDISAVVEDAGLDATSKASLAAALATLYAVSTPQQREDPVQEHPLGSAAGPSSTREVPSPAEIPSATTTALPNYDLGPEVALPTESVGPLPLEPDFSVPPSTPFTATPPTPPAVPPPAAPPAAPAPASFMPAPAMPGGAPLPGGLPSLGNAARSSFGELRRADVSDRGPAGADIPPDPQDREPGDAAEHIGEASDTAETPVHLPDGDTVTAPSPELAAAITAAVGGTPISEAFRMQGIALPAAGSEVIAPLDPLRLLPGDIGVFPDRHALALGHGKVLLDKQIQPIAAVSGSGFLGWQHPPEPDATSTMPDAPASDPAAATVPS
jgi:hypothetical protein